MLYAPAGMEIDLRGAGTCTQATLQQRGPSGCPADSRAGFGGGVGVLALPKETSTRRTPSTFSSPLRKAGV